MEKEISTQRINKREQLNVKGLLIKRNQLIKLLEAYELMHKFNMKVPSKAYSVFECILKIDEKILTSIHRSID